MVNSHHISIFQRVLNNIYISFWIVVFILIGELLYLTLYQIVRYMYRNTFLYTPSGPKYLQHLFLRYFVRPM